MKRGLIIGGMAVLMIGIISSGAAIAAETDCTVESVSGTKVILDCGSGAGNLSGEMKVKVKNSARKKAIEGC